MLPCSWLTRNSPEGIQMEMQSSPQWRKKYRKHLMGISSLNNCNTANGNTKLSIVEEEISEKCDDHIKSE